MPTIKLKSISFTKPPFRKLGDLTIPFAERITLIAGHNGIGKSTILGITANCSGLTEKGFLGSLNESYFGRIFKADLSEIIHIDYENEFVKVRAENRELPMPCIEFDIDGTSLTKRSTLTKRTSRLEARAVPRTHPSVEFTSNDGSVVVGTDGKVPLPTIYLGMTRMLPIGESEPSNVTSTTDKTFPVEDAAFIRDFTNSVLRFDMEAEDPGAVITQGIKGTRKIAKHTPYGYSTKCISLGQDSLSAIATALASFNKLKREWAHYPGGLLVIDELDAGFHPKAQRQLAAELKTVARRLNLQILATTHSLSLIEAIHPDANPVGKGGKQVDLVQYIADPTRPYLTENYSLEDIRHDMNVTLPALQKKPKAKSVKVYFEDAEAAYVFKVLVPTQKQRDLNKAYDIKLNPYALGVGGGNLVGLNAHDPYFRKAVLAVDADTPVTGKFTANVIKLPGGGDATGKGLSPERTLKAFIHSLIKKASDHAQTWESLKASKVTTQYLQNFLVDNIQAGNGRIATKSWWATKLPFIKRWKLYELWIAENPTKAAEFDLAFENAIKAALGTEK